MSRPGRWGSGVFRAVTVRFAEKLRSLDPRLRGDDFSELFAQLGLANDKASIQRFIDTHSPMPDGMRLEDAPFWSSVQSQLLHEERQNDADWAMVVDRLNVALHATPG